MVLIPIGTVLFALPIFYRGVKELLDTSAQLKLAKNGLWTKKLGFVNWDDINYVEVVEEKDRRSPQTYFEIRLKGTKFEEANVPDERLLLTDIQNKDDVEMMANDLIFQYNQGKKVVVSTTETSS